MKYVITGAAGHIAKPLTLELLARGQAVTVIGRSPQNLEILRQAGARIEIGSVEDESFLVSAFSGADAAFCLYPPDNSSSDIRSLIEKVANNYKKAIETNHVHRVVNLSSIGAHLAAGAGPVSGLYRAEQVMNSIQGSHILHLRPVYFYTNLFGQIDAIRFMNCMAGNFALPRFGIADPADIAHKAASELLALNFEKHSYQYVSSDEVSTDQIAAEIGNAIGKPGLRWQRISDADMASIFKQAGFSNEMAAEMVEMFSAFDNGKMTTDYFEKGPAQWGKTKLADFARVFAQVYHSRTAETMTA